MDTDFLNQWATKIAREATPDEIYQASFVTIAFARGGKERKKLFHQTGGSEAGGSGLVDMTQVVLPYIFQALVISGPIIYKLLSDGAINNSIDLVKFLREVYDDLKKKRAHKTAKDQSGTSFVEPPQPSSPSVPTNQASTDAQTEQLRAIRAQIEELLKNMPEQMAPSRVDPEELEDKSYHTLVALFKEPEDAKKLIDLLGKKK